MEDLLNTLKVVKDIDFSNCTISMYIVKRKLIHKEASYEIKFVNIHDKLKKRLKQNAITSINEANSVKDYDYYTTDLDNNLLGIQTAETDMLEITNHIENENPNIGEIKNAADLQDSWIYLLKLDFFDKKSLYFVRKITGGWKVKKKISLDILQFKDNKLIELGEDLYFTIDNKIDFFVYDKVLFIAHKSNFETVLNFREGMIKNKETVITEFRDLKIFVDADKLSELVGSNIARLRKLSQIKKSGYYKDSTYLVKLKNIGIKKNWGIEYSNQNEIIVHEENLDTILRLLNNDRLSSLINEEDFDVDIKHKI